jgi:deoxyribodipyrimidine photo-lyase
MSRDQRIHANHALLVAQKHALAKMLPLAVVFCLYPKSGDRAREQYEFMLEGLVEVDRNVVSLQIPFMMLLGEPEEKLSAAFAHLLPDAVYFDFNPLRGPRKLQAKLAKEANAPMYVVDTHNIVPVWVASDKQEVGAYSLRPKLHKLLSSYLQPTEEIVPHPYAWPGTIIPMADLSEQIKTLVSAIPRNGITYSFASGESAASQHLGEFISEKLERYAVDRNDPSSGAQSGLSPYLHFGQISSLQVALRLQEVAIENGENLHFLSSPKMPKPEDAGTTLLHGIDSLIEEMVVRKELADNFCFYNPDYDNLESAPNWAKISLDKHRQDKREYVYSYKELDAAKTHDTAWNAAQSELTKTGKMHGYMRMYWAKKVLEWTNSPEEAIEYLIKLNDFYSIDGGDPNGYAGILWSVGGVHDRPWMEREIFGVVRYMNYAGLKRKFDIESYQNLNQ